MSIKSTLQMTAQDPNVMIARVFNHLPLALKMNVSGKSFASDVKNLVREFLFYDKSKYFGHNFQVQIILFREVYAHLHILTFEICQV
jgi:hypothetical protein